MQLPPARRLRAPAALALALLAPACGGDAPEPLPTPDHVLLVVVDTLRADGTSVLRPELANAPHLEALAASGVTFTRAVSQSSWTSPSMVSLMTGHWIAEGRLHLPPDLPTLAEVFQGGGWTTGAFIANGIVSEDNGFRRGFERFEQMSPYDEPPFEGILEWLEANRDRRTFTYVHLNEPHDPYVPPEPYLKRRLDPPPLSAEREAYYRDVSERLGLVDDDASMARIREEIGGYEDDVRVSDERIGRLVAKLEELGLAGRAAVVVASDHGEGLWTREAFLTGQRGKHLAEGRPPTLFNQLMPTHGNQVNWELVHVPLVVRAPGLPAGARIDAPVENVDIYPTLLELCDLPHPGDLHGESLVDRILGRAPPADPAFSFTRFNASVVTPDGWQLIVPTPLGECEEGLELALYDLNADPEARTNLAAAHPERVEELEAVVLARLKRGISGDGMQVSAGDLEVLKGLGYTDNGIVELARERLLALPTAELLAMLESKGSTCLERLEAARALAERELVGADRARIAAVADAEPSTSVRAVLERLR